MSRDVLHVVPQDEIWGVKREGNERNSSTHPTQKEAIDAARALAREGDDIVIHRPDGTIRDRVTYTGAAGGNGATGTGTAQPAVRPQDLISVGSRVSWQAILAGVAVTFAVYLCLTLFAVAIGVSTMDHVHGKTFAISGAIVGLVSLLAALFIGGNVASRLSTRETHTEAVVYGVLLWAAFFFLLLLTGMNVGGSLGQMGSVVRQPAVEAKVAQGSASPEAATRAEEVRAKGEQLVADMNPAALAWWAFGVMVLSVGAAIGGALTGAGPVLEFLRGPPVERMTVKPV